MFVETDASKKEITQEYDPAKPNDYSVVNALIQKRKREKKYEEEVYLIIDGHGLLFLSLNSESWTY